ncbi:MAG: nitrogen regulation protein NR(II) [Gammaproteobacteria bacterium]|nr:nitrogen regulation protein NR(II) [Gammaproteobacteria bacterium]
MNTAYNQQVLDNMSTAVLVFDYTQALVYMNPAAEVIFEVSQKRILGTSAKFLLAGSESLMASFNRACRQGMQYTEREQQLDLPDNRKLTIDCTFSPLFEPGVKHGVLVEINSLERHKRISREEALITQHQITKTVMRGLAHEINNPLGGLRGAAQLLEKELSDASLREYTSIIIGEADRLQKLLSQILGPNKIPKKEQINIHELLHHVRRLVSAEKTGITIKFDYDPSIPELYIDQDQLIQAILNIVRNAVQATKETGEIILKTRVGRYYTIGTIQHRLVVKIEIIDNGSGIPADMIEKIFYPMVTGRAEGTGLGLSIAQSIINNHGGIIECDSKEGKTTFAIVLPMEAQEYA